MRIPVCWAAAIVCAAGVTATTALADTVYLDDGSQVNGKVTSMSSDTLVLGTAFAGDLKIDRSAVAGLTTDDAVQITLASGQSGAGRLEYDASQSRQMYVVDGERRTADAADAPLAGIDLIAPDVVAANRKEADDARALPESDILPPENGDYWSGRVELGISGNAGNTETTSVQGNASVLRDTGDSRLSLSASADHQSEDGDDTADEYVGKGRYESDFTRRAFWFMQQELEKDRFENIDLRSRTLVGPGYFLARRDRLTFKVRSGVGYQYEIYSDDAASGGEMIVSLGWDYAQLVGDWLKLTHEFTAYPEVTDEPGQNYTLESALGAEIPLASSAVWSIRGALEHEYNHNPQPGVDELDTSYTIGVVRDF
ncbi:DUF481 domain-containing protein [Salinisphaera aquimarina]|uniref:YdiY family protein n=1 Tax=Salinisphaera aquimarina TaxID=2094031 RepID=A0ABV7ETG5_9GAMM